MRRALVALLWALCLVLTGCAMTPPPYLCQPVHVNETSTTMILCRPITPRK